MSELRQRTKPGLPDRPPPPEPAAREDNRRLPLYRD